MSCISTCMHYFHLHCYSSYYFNSMVFTVIAVSQVSSLGHLNITHYFGQHGCLLRIYYYKLMLFILTIIAYYIAQPGNCHLYDDDCTGWSFNTHSYEICCHPVRGYSFKEFEPTELCFSW